MGYLYYCKKCNAFEVANTDNDPMVRHWDCAQKCLPLYVTDEAWKRLTPQDRGSLIQQAVGIDARGDNPKRSKADASVPQKIERRPEPVSQTREEQPSMASEPTQTITPMQTSAPSQVVAPIQANAPAQNYGNNAVGNQGRVSGLSIAAFILTMTGGLSFIGFILALVDVCKKDGRKKGLSIAALIISSLAIIGVIALIVGAGSLLTMFNGF